jgi:hypothetical protein
VEVLPNGGTIGGNGYNYCVDQGFNGSGDGLVMLATGGTWNWSHIGSNWNAQDGFDSLHVGDDSVTRPTINMDYIYAEGNEGQSIKGGGGHATLRNSIGIANCDVFANGSNFPLNPVGWNALVGLRCRANDAMAFGMRDGDTLTIENVTNTGEQNIAWDFANAACTSTTTCTIIFKNNTTMSYISPTYGTYAGAFNFGGPDSFSNPSSAITNNAWYHMGNSGISCPIEGSETNYVCGSPLFTSQSNVDAVNTLPTSLSPLRGAGVTISGITTDYSNYPRPSPPGIGALEYQAVSPFTFTTGGNLVFSGSVTF